MRATSHEFIIKANKLLGIYNNKSQKLRVLLTISCLFSKQRTCFAFISLLCQKVQKLLDFVRGKFVRKSCLTNWKLVWLFNTLNEIIVILLISRPLRYLQRDIWFFAFCEIHIISITFVNWVEHKHNHGRTCQYQGYWKF